MLVTFNQVKHHPRPQTLLTIYDKLAVAKRLLCMCDVTYKGGLILFSNNLALGIWICQMANCNRSSFRVHQPGSNNGSPPECSLTPKGENTKLTWGEINWGGTCARRPGEELSGCTGVCRPLDCAVLFPNKPWLPPCRENGTSQDVSIDSRKQSKSSSSSSFYW